MKSISSPSSFCHGRAGQECFLEKILDDLDDVFDDDRDVFDDDHDVVDDDNYVAADDHEYDVFRLRVGQESFLEKILDDLADVVADDHDVVDNDNYVADDDHEYDVLFMMTMIISLCLRVGQEYFPEQTLDGLLRLLEPPLLLSINLLRLKFKYLL